MNIEKQQIFTPVVKLALLVLYALFFMVQLFYNFDSSNQPGHASIVRVQQTSKQGAPQAVNKAQASDTKSPVFRLNKRYQPQPAINCNTIIVKQLVCAVSSRLHIHYSKGFFPPAFPSAHALRGPPVV